MDDVLSHSNSLRKPRFPNFLSGESPAQTALALILLAATAPAGAIEGEPEFGGLPVDDLTSSVEDTTDTEFTGNMMQRLAKNWPPDLVVAPIPGRSPQLGWKLALAGGYFLETNKEETARDVPPSIVGGYAMAAENGSYVFGGGAKFNLLDDKLRVTTGLGYADIRYRFYGIGNNAEASGLDLDILQDGHMFFAEGSWRLWRSLFVGVGYTSGQLDTRARLGDQILPGQFNPTLSLDIGAFTIPIKVDSRDDEQFPREGWLVSGRGVFYRESVGSDFETETFKLAVNHYMPVRETDVLASRFVIRTTSDNAPFFILSTFGGAKDLRGYPSGRYRDRMMYAMQTEYRWHVTDRWVLTGFAGVGEVAERFSDFGENFLPAAGVGARFVLSQKHHVSLSADIAVGNDGTEFYFGVGEAF
jgi:hypothetical protein